MDSSSPLDLDSTSKLLSRLDLIEKNTRLKNMDDMDTDLLFEVRDTSDRMAMIPLIHGSSGPSVGREDVEEIDMPSSGQRMGSARKTYAHCRKDSGLYRKGNSTTARNDNEQLCRQASLTRLISRTLDAKPSSQAQGAVLELEQNKVFNESKKSMKTIESSQKNPLPIAYHKTQRRGLRRKKGKEQLPVFDGGDVGLKSRDKGKGIVLSCDTLQIDASRRHMGQGRLVRNDYIFPCNIAKSHTSSEVNGQNTTNSVDGETCSSLVEISNQDNMKGIDLHRVSQPETGQGLLRQSQSDTIPRNSGPRKMVHNGCISPHNMAQGKNAAEDDVGETVFNGLSYGFSSHQIHAVSPDSEGIHADKKKGKVILDDNTVSNTQNIQATPHSARVCSITGKEVTVIADDDSALRSSKDIGWRTAHDLAKKAPVYSLHRSASVSKREDTSSYLSDRSHEIVTGNRDNVNLVHDSPDITVSCHKLNPSAPRASSESEPQSTRRQRRQKFMKGKRKCNSDSSSNDGYSSSALEGSGTSCLQSSRQFPNTKLTRTCDSQHQGTTLGPVIEVDELQSTEVRCRYPQEQSGRVPDDTSARARQLESDEILARQLQEQFFHELPGFGGAEEIDAAISWSLQQEDARRAVSIARRDQSNPIDAAIAWELQQEDAGRAVSIARRDQSNPIDAAIAWSLQQEDARRAVSIARRDQSNPRDTSIAHLYGHYPQLPFQNSSGRSANRDRAPTSSRRRRNFYSHEMDLETTMMAEVRRNFSSAEMDLEMRHNFLEALEAAFDNSNDMFAENVLQINRDFNENDYDILLSLDDNNHQRVGASESQINSLPQSVIQIDNIEEACAVCLESPSIGDIIRHLPCLHKFHKECIDTWLRRRTSCPVCKSDII